jgi:hypothetical protein
MQVSMPLAAHSATGVDRQLSCMLLDVRPGV